MYQANSCLYFVHILAAFTSGAEKIPFNVIFFYLNIIYSAIGEL